MARCTAPVRGHYSAAAAAECPACRGHYGRSYSSPSYSYPSYSPPSYSAPSYSSPNGGGGGGSTKTKARWSRPSSTVLYTPAQITSLEPVRKAVEKRASIPDIRDVFLCHAWDDRKGPAKELHDLLEASKVTTWFSEKDIPYGTPFMREIDKGLANSKMGIVLVTPHFLKRIKAEGVADKELSVLLARDQLIPVMHGATYDDLRNVSPLLGSRNGFDTAEESMADIAVKVSELVETRLPGF
jgi:hypothetical protein